MKINNKKGYGITIGLLGLAVYSAISFIGSVSFLYKTIFGSITYFLGIYFALKHTNSISKTKLFWIISFFPFVIFVFMNIFQFKATYVSFASNLFLILSCIGGYLFYKKSTIFIPLVLTITIAGWFLFAQQYFFNKVWYGSFSNEVSVVKPQTPFFDTSGKEVILPKNGKVMILDFWNTRCGPCYELFPYIDSINRIIDTSKFKIYIVNMPMDDEKMEKNFKRLYGLDYSFTELFVKNDSLKDSLKVTVYPTTYVIKDETIIYKGEFEPALKKFNIIQ